MINILQIPFFPPNKINPSAGTQISTYFSSRFAEDPNFNVKILTFKVGDEVISNIDNANVDYIDISKKPIERIKRALFELKWQINPFDKSAGHYYGYRAYQLQKKFRQYPVSDKPDVVILEWVECILYADVIKKCYPKAKVIGFIHDVCFQKISRQVSDTQNMFSKFFLKIQNNRLHRFETDSYSKCDHLIVLNYKDRDLLLKEGFASDGISIVSPFFQKMDYCTPVFSNNVLFWGDLGRPENYKACIWFINNVFNVLIKSLAGIKFIIAGKNAPEELTQYANEHIIITGFVNDIKPVFEDAFCFVAPLYLGAGIKIKILEAMSASLPVLTGDVGIEGINAKNGKEYFHCNNSQEYINMITELYKNKITAKDMGKAGSEFINRSFSYQQSLVTYKDLIKHLVQPGK